jgi:hypothetical protein
MKANKMHYFSDLFDKVLYIFRTGPLSIIRNISTLYTQQYMLVLLAYARVVHASRRQHDKHLLRVYSVTTPDDGQRTCPKYVEYFIK